MRTKSEFFSKKSELKANFFRSFFEENPEKILLDGFTLGTMSLQIFTFIRVEQTFATISFP